MAGLLPFWASSTLLIIPLGWISWTIYRLASNYAVARRVGVPLIVLPINPESPAWMLVSDLTWPYLTRVLSWVPFCWCTRSFVRYAHRGWDVRDRADSFLELGDAFIFVTTGKNWLYVCNAESVTEMLLRKTEFRRPVEIMGEFYGFCALSLSHTHTLG